MFDIKEKLAKTQRRVEGFPVEEAMLAEHEKIAQKINSGKALALALVKDIQARMPNAKKGYEMIALLGYEDKYARMVASFFNPGRLIVSPTLPALPVRSPLIITFLFGVLGGILAILWQFRDLVTHMIKAIRAEENVNRTADSSLGVNKGMHRVQV